NDTLQIADLMRQAELKNFGRRLQLRAIAIANPNFDAQTTHHGVNLRSASGRNDRVIDACVTNENPLPPVLRLDASAGFITLNDFPSDDLFFDFFRDWLGLLSSTFEDRDYGAFAQLDAVQITHRLDNSFSTQVLGLFVKDNRRFQNRAEIPFGFETSGKCTVIHLLTMWAGYYVLLSFDHNRFGRWQFGDLPSDHIVWFETLQFGVAMLAFIHWSGNDSIRVLDQRTRVFGMTERRPVFFAFLVRRRIGFLIARRRLR